MNSGPVSFHKRWKRKWSQLSKARPLWLTEEFDAQFSVDTSLLQRCLECRRTQTHCLGGLRRNLPRHKDTYSLTLYGAFCVSINQSCLFLDSKLLLLYVDLHLTHLHHTLFPPLTHSSYLFSCRHSLLNERKEKLFR